MGTYVNISTEFYYVVRDMRAAQKAYFAKDNAHRKEHMLADAKAKEAEVDKWLKKIEDDMERWRAYVGQ